MSITVAPGSTSVKLILHFTDPTTNGPNITIQANRTSYEVAYIRPGEDVVTGAGVALGAFNSVFSARGLFEINTTTAQGECRVDVPDGAFAVGVPEVRINIEDQNGVVVCGETISLTALSETARANIETAGENYSATRGLSGTALPAVVAGAASGIPLKDASNFLAVLNLPAVADGANGGLPLVGAQIPNANADAVGGLPISDAGGLDLDTLLGVLTSLAAEPRSANLLDQLKTIIAVIESQRGFHTHQPSTGAILFVDQQNGTTAVGGADGGIGNPYDSYAEAKTDAGTDFGHDLYILVAGVTGAVTTHVEAFAVDEGYDLIRGPGRGLIVIAGSAVDTFAVTADGCEISGMQINSFQASGSGVGVSFTTADFGRVHDCWILDTRGDGVHIERSTNCIVEDSHFKGTGTQGSGQGVHITGSGGGEDAEDNVVRRNHFADTGGTAILLDGGLTNDATISDNEIHDAGGWGIEITGSSENAQVKNNNLGNNASGNITDGGTDSIILNNYDVVDGVWDEPLTASTHNVSTSSGRRLRDITGTVTHTGDVVSSTANTITLDAAAAATDGSYDPSQIIVDDGAGNVQIRGIIEYFGSGGGNSNAARTAVIDRDWKTEPDNTWTFIIFANDGRLSTNEGQLRAATSTVLKLNSLAPGAGGADLSGQLIQLMSGTGQDQAALILSYNGTDQEATVAALEVTPDATTGYQILPFGMTSLEAINNDAQVAIDLKAILDGTGAQMTVSGDTKVTNGTFTGSATGWTDASVGGDAAATYSANAVTLTSDSGGGGFPGMLSHDAAMTLIVGRTYRVTGDVTGNDVRLLIATESIDEQWTAGANSSTLTATTTSTGAGGLVLANFSGAPGQSATIDNITLEEVLDVADTISGTLEDTDSLVTTVGVAGVGLSDLGGMSTAMKAEVESEVNDALDTVITEITGASDIPTTPTMRQALMLPYMWIRNDSTVTATERRIKNDVGTEILDATMSDDSTTFSPGKLGDA